MEFGVKQLAKAKAKDIDDYQTKNLKIIQPILIPHVHTLFN
jgi:hypothetical protein